MNLNLPVQQRGISFGGFLVGIIAVVAISIFLIQLIPAYMQNGTIKSVFNAITHDPDMQKAAPSEIRASFSRRSSIDDIKAIKPEDIEISVDQGKLVLSASYFVKIPLAGNISLYLDFNPTSGQ